MEIETGDIIQIRTAHNWLGRLTQFFTRSPYTHTGMALWFGGIWWLVELNGGRNHITMLVQWADYDVYARPAEVSEDAAREAALAWLATPQEYGYLAFIVIGVLNWLRIRVFVHWRRILVCAGAIVAILERAGWSEHSRIVSPADLAREMVFKFAVRPSTT
jgi:hypothetical protein